MRYGDLVQFEPIESVVQIREADEAAQARRLVETYVISDRMAEQLADTVIPQLQFATPRDNKGVLVVGNYGTGKSHLMSVVSAVAEYPELVEALSHQKVREAAGAIAGRFKVLRTEVGAVEGSLRSILVRELERALEQWGAPYRFPPADELTNNKDSILEAVAGFRERYPDHGLLLVVDELLDYLRSRKDQQLILDLGFLRELGEVAALSPFRFLGGLQETLFESPRFAFVAEPLRRVRDRFEQVSIARQDIAFVVANRLLRKTDEQLARIDAYLRPFAPLYGKMAERMDEFVHLFPIHPSYLDTFQNVVVAEKREVLKTFSNAMGAMLDQEVPTDRPGLLSFDHYWGVLRANPTMRTYPEVAEVLDKGTVLERLVEQSYTRPALREVALRIVRALGVYRLTTDDITRPIGITPEELRDGLCLYVRTPEANADFLLDQVRVALREIVRTVSGQYLSYNDANDQWYLDVKKDIDFDAKIGERGDALDDDQLNTYFFDALRLALGLNPETYVTGHQIRFYELPWNEKRVTRPGYLFFGAPDERSTAQPPRDFYVYILPPYLGRAAQLGEKDDEVIFRLTQLDDDFSGTLRRYAGARALENESATHRTVYGGKATEARNRLLRWLNDHLATHLEVVYQGVAQPLSAVLPRAGSTATQGLEDLLRLVAATKLAPQFAEAYPHYPAFTRLTQPIYENARAGNAIEAIRAVAGRPRTNLATAVLEGLELLAEDGVLRPERSRYARRYLELLRAKDDGQVVNRNEVIRVVAGGVDKPVEKDPALGLEPEWVAVVLTALTYAGEIALTTENREALDAASVERAGTIALESLTRFGHFGRPKQVPTTVWTQIFEGLELNAALVKDEAKRDVAVRDLLNAVAREQERVVRLQQALGQGGQGLKLWNAPVFTDQFQLQSEKGAVVGSNLPAVPLTTTAYQAAIRGYRQFLEELAKYNTVGKLRNLKLYPAEVTEAFGYRRSVGRGEELVRLVGQLQPLTAYLAEAHANLPAEHPWAGTADAERQAILDDVRRFGNGDLATRDGAAIQSDLEALKREYAQLYAALHREATLDAAADARRVKLHDDQRLTALNTLAAIELLNKSELAGWKAAIVGLRSCPQFHPGVLTDSPTCPFCSFRPSQRSATASAEAHLVNLDGRLDVLVKNWRTALRSMLVDEQHHDTLRQMTEEERGPIQEFLSQRDDDPEIPFAFVKSAKTAFQGIVGIQIEAEELYQALADGGLPCAPEELKRRFKELVDGKAAGAGMGRVRVSLERPSPPQPPSPNDWERGESMVDARGVAGS